MNAQPHESSSSQRDGELELTAVFRSALRRFRHTIEAKTSEVGLTPQRYDLLLMIKAGAAADRETTIGSLCHQLDLQQSAVTELVKRAEQAGLLTRTRSIRDGRVSLLHLTRDGDARLMLAFTALADDRARLAEAFRLLETSFHASDPADASARSRQAALDDRDSPGLSSYLPRKKVDGEAGTLRRGK